MSDEILEAMRERIARGVKTRYGERRAVKIGTLSGSVSWVRPLNNRGLFDLIEGAYVEIRDGHGDKWQGPLKIWQATDERLFLEWV